MEAIIITLLILLVFLLSCDSQLLQSIKDMIFTPMPPPDEDLDILEDELMITDNTATVKGDNFMNSREASNTWEPSTATFSKLGNDKIYKAYAEDLKANVDRSIVESHREYTEDSDYLATTGASHASARDDFMPAVKFHGLPRKAHYAQLGAENTARTAQSETPEAVADLKMHNSTGYAL